MDLSRLEVEAEAPSAMRDLRFPFECWSDEGVGVEVESGAVEVEGAGGSSTRVSARGVLFSKEGGVLFGEEANAAAAAAEPGGMALRFTLAGRRVAQRPCTDLLRAFPFYGRTSSTFRTLSANNAGAQKCPSRGKLGGA